MYLNTLLLQHLPADCPGCFWSWFLWMLSAFALGLGIGKWIWGKYAHQIQQKNKNLNVLKTKNEALEKDFIALKYQLNEFDKDNKGLKASLANSTQNMTILTTQLDKLGQKKSISSTEKQPNEIKIVPNPEVVEKNIISDQVIKTTKEEIISKKEDITEVSENIPSISNQIITKDNPINTNTSDTLNYSPYLNNKNLKVVANITPKIENILNKAGYHTWENLAKAKTIDLEDLMHDAGPRYRVHNPQNWQKQIQLCLTKDWLELIRMQQKVSIETNHQKVNTSSLTRIETIIAENMGFENLENDNLKIIKGINPTLENLLQIGGIKNWKDLANASVERIEKILAGGGENFKSSNPASWPIQAEFIINHNWVELKKYQDKN